MKVFKVSVTLEDVQPPIWRCLEISADTHLGRLHRILQAAMGWADSHLHAVHVGGTVYGIPEPDLPDDTKASAAFAWIRSLASMIGSCTSTTSAMAGAIPS